jgi:dTDP-4-amino-4,6-dideoxygalactose transaminase
MSARLAIDGGKPVRKDFLIFGSPQILDPEIEEVSHTLRSGWLSTGPKTHQFEKRFSEYVGSRYALGLSSCTAGLYLALEVVGVDARSEVITTPMTFPSTANVIVHHRARPIFVDIEKETMNIDPEKIESKITAKTKVIVPVHLAGRPCKMDQITEIAKRKHLYIIEDAAHAIETKYRSRKVGIIGDITVFSFYVTKNLVTGEGGMATTDNAEWAEEMRVKSLHGISTSAWKRYSSEGFQPYETIYPGYKFNMSDIQASLGLHQLKRLEDNLKIRERHWRRYNEAFSQILEISIPIEEDNIRHARHLYTILLNLERLKISRNRFIIALKAENIGTGVHFTALHLHPYYKNTFGFKRGDFPNTEYVSDRTVSLPMSAKLTEKDVDDVITAVKKVIGHFKR